MFIILYIYTYIEFHLAHTDMRTHILLPSTLLSFSLFLFSHFSFRRLTNCPIKFCWTFSPIYRIEKFVVRHVCAGDGVKLPTIRSSGKMYRCDPKCPVCMWALWTCYCNWYPYDLEHPCGTLNYPSNLLHTRCSMNWPVNARTWHTCCWIFQPLCSCTISVKCKHFPRNCATCAFACRRSSLWKGSCEKFTISSTAWRLVFYSTTCSSRWRSSFIYLISSLCRFCIWLAHTRRSKKKRRKSMK